MIRQNHKGFGGPLRRKLKVFAVVETGSKQYRVQPGQLIKVDRLDGEKDGEIRLEKVLMISDEASGVTIGTPVVTGAAIRATIVEQGKGEKIRVFKFKSKKRYRKTRGHRSQLTTLKIEEILQA
jgi:large subunit ribosomal protein L21